MYEGIRGLYERMYKESGVAAAEHLIWLIADELGGQRVTIPSSEVLHREGRDTCIRADYDTGTYSLSQLAMKFDLDERTISRILKKESLFGKEEV
jgi:Mor family transcriptional regulator